MRRTRGPGLLRVVTSTASGQGTTLVLGVAMAVANVLGYASVLVVSISFGPAAFGAVAALTSIGVIASIPAGALQLLVAGRHGGGADTRSAYWVALAVGSGLFGLLLAASPLVARSMSLDSPWPVVWLGLTLVPMTLTGAQQGYLLGTRSLVRLATHTVVVAGLRLLASAWCVWVDPSVSTAFGAWALVAVLGAVLGHLLCLAPVSPRLQRAGGRQLVPLLVRSSLAMSGLVALTSVDTILARHHLSATDSGLYGVTSMFAKVVFWGSQFVAMAVVPRLARGDQARLLRRAGGVVLAIAAPLCLVMALVPGPLLEVAGLGDYAAAAPLLLPFTALGTLWALLQVAVFADIGRGTAATPGIILGCIAAQVVVVGLWLHDSPLQIWTATVATAVVAALVIAVSAGRGRRSSVDAA